MLEKIKVLLGILSNDTSKDDILKIYIEDSTEEVKQYINSTDVPKELEGLIRDIVIIKYNRRGSEGLISENVGGMGRSYLDDIPKEIKRKLKRFRKLPTRENTSV